MNRERCTAPINGQASAMKTKISHTSEPWPKLFANTFNGNRYCSMLKGAYCPSAEMIEF